jgi:hypothetical protein
VGAGARVGAEGGDSPCRLERWRVRVQQNDHNPLVAPAVAECTIWLKRTYAPNVVPARSRVSRVFSNDLLVPTRGSRIFKIVYLRPQLEWLLEPSRMSSSAFAVAFLQYLCCSIPPVHSSTAGSPPWCSRLSPQTGSIESAKAFSAAVQERFLTLPFGRPNGHLVAAAAAAASCSRGLRACRLASTSRLTVFDNT